MVHDLKKTPEEKPIQVTPEREEQIKEFVLNFIKGRERCLEFQDSLTQNFIRTKTCRTVTDANDFFRCMVELGLDMCKSKVLSTDEDLLGFGPEYKTAYDLKHFAHLRGWL